MIRFAAAVLALSGTAAAQEPGQDFLTLSFGEATFRLAAADVMTAARHDGPVLLIILQDRVHNDYVFFTNDHIGKEGIVRICGETVGPLRLETSAYFASMTLQGLSEDAIARWVSVLRSRTCDQALAS